MPLKYIKASLPHLNLLTKIFLILAILAMSAFAAFAVRMSKGPLDLQALKPTIEAALSNSEKGYTVKINKMALTWPDMTDAVLLDLNGVQIIQQEITSLNIGHVVLGLSGINLLRGKILPSVIMIDAPTFQLTQEDGSLNLFWQDKENKEKNDDGISKSPQEVRTSIQKILSQITDPQNNDINALSALKRFEVKQAVITGKEFQKETMGHLALVDLSLEKNNLGLGGKLNISLASEEGKNAQLKSDILYRRAEKDVTFTADVKDINPQRFQAFFPEYKMLTQQNLFLSGDVKAAFDDKLRLQMATLNLSVPEGELVFPEIYDAPILLKNISFEAQLNRLEKFLNITKFEANAGGITLKATAQGNFSKGNITAPVEINIADLPLENIPPIFPKSHLESSAGEWLTQKLSDGRLYNVVLTTDFNVTRDPATNQRDAKMTNTKVSFDFEDVSVKYSDTLMPVTKSAGSGFYENDTLTINGKSGNVGDITGTNLKMTMTNLSVKGGGHADINLDASGPLKTALKFASDEPISVGDDLGFDIKNVKGNLDFNVQLNFPTVKNLPKEKVKVVIKGTAKDLLLPAVVKGQDLTGGPYDLGFKDGAITLKGKGQLAGRPIELDWLQYLESTGREYESKIIAKITADQGLRDIFGIGLEDYISGPLPVDVTYIDKGVKATIDVKGDLTTTVLHIDPFDYKKPEQVGGDLSLKAILNGQDLKEIDHLKLTTKGFSIENGRLIFRQLKDGSTDIAQGALPKVTLGKSIVSVNFEITPQDLLKARVNGSVVDIQPFINQDQKSKNQNQEKTEEGRPMQISVAASKLLGDEGEAIGASKIYLEMNKQGDITRIEMDSKIGSGDMYLRFKPEEQTSKRTFRLESTDAGHTLKVFGLYDKVRGGTLLIYGQPQKGDLRGNLFGTAKMENFEVKSAPALAKLLSVMSLQGVRNLLNNEGLGFAKLESDFEWRFHEKSNLLVMKEGRTSGSSIGLTFEGLINQAENNIDVSGTIIPVSGVNNAVSDIPVLGKLLTGGEALIAATYSMKGAANDPKISINPLSVLAPGFLRKLFFEGDVDAKVKREENKMDIPAEGGANDNVPSAEATPEPDGVQQPVVTAPNVNTN